MQTLDKLASILGPDVLREYNEALDLLQTTGLTLYEAKTYLALIVKGYGEVSVIAATANIPRTSAYKSLESLRDKGYIYSENGRPVVYKPYSPLDVSEKIIEKIKNVFQKLNDLRNVVEEVGDLEVVYMIKGFDEVIEKIKDILNASTRKFVISSPKFNVIRDQIEKELDKALKRGVNIIIIHPPFQRVPQNVESYIKDDLITTDVLGDSEQALLAGPDLSIAGYTNNPILAEHLEAFISSLIDFAKMKKNKE
ncbi:MAG: TrmB family transcriptional regulator [Thermoplasmata archaeon]